MLLVVITHSSLRMSEDSNNSAASDDDSISALFDNINDLTLVDQVDGNNEDDASALTSGTARSQQRQRKLKRQHRKGKSKSQHSLEHLRQRVSHLMSIFENQGWFIPLPESTTSISNQNKSNKNSSEKKGKVWSNRNYGADKKRQRKQSEKQTVEARIAQLEAVLKDEHGMTFDCK